MTGDNQKLNQELGDLKEEEVDHLPEMIRQRMDNLYAHLDEVALGATRVKSKDRLALDSQMEEVRLGNRRSKPGKHWPKTLALAISSVAAAGILIIGSGFVSPVMADALKQIPLVGSLFTTAGDEGLKAAKEQGLTSNVNLSVSHDGVKFTVSDLIYDGNRLSLVLTREAEDGTHQTIQEWMDGARKISFLINGVPINTGMSMPNASNEASNSMIITTFQSVILKDMDSTEVLKIPDQFELGVKIYDDQRKYDYMLNIPVKKADMDNILFQPKETKSLGNNTFEILKLEMTPATVRLDMQMEGKSGEDIKEIAEKLPDKYKIDGFINIDFDLVDDKGTVLKSLGGSGSGRSNTYWFTGTYEPLKQRPKSITVKPFTHVNGKKVYIPEIEFVLPAPGQ